MRLGFPWPTVLFHDGAACRAVTAANAAERPAEAALDLVEAAVITADGDNALAWRDWLGLPDD